MTEYTIAFDFPESDGPWFAAKLKDGLGFTRSLADSLRFTDETVTQNVLDSGYGGETRSYGVVVEVGS